MTPLYFVVPGSITNKTGGSIYDRRMVEALRALGRPIEVLELEDSFPNPTEQAQKQAADTFRGLPDGAVALVDGLAFCAMPDVVEREAARLRLAALVHLPLAVSIDLDADIDDKVAAALDVAERRALAAAAIVIVTGKATLPMLPDNVPADRIVVVEPGTDRAPIAKGSGGSRLELLCVGSISPVKGQDLLVEALAGVPHKRWHLTCAGSMRRHQDAVRNLKATARNLGVDVRMTLAGELDQTALSGLYDRSDLFVLATRQETYGMAVAEALAHGLPVVSTSVGAIPDLVGTEAGIVVPPADVPALTEALSKVMGDAALRGRLAEGAGRVRLTLPAWSDAGAAMHAALSRFDENG